MSLTMLHTVEPFLNKDLYKDYITFLKQPPGIFTFVILPLENPEKTSFHPCLGQGQNCVKLPGNSKSSKTKTHGNSMGSS